MKVLVVTTRSPYPLFEGRALRSYHLIRQAAQAHEVHLLSFVQNAEDLAGLRHMRSICPVVAHEKLHYCWPRAWLLLDALRELFSRSPLQVMKYRSGAMARRLRALMAEHRYDLVHLDMVHLAEYQAVAQGPAPAGQGTPPCVLAVHNVESMILQRRADTETRALQRAYLRYQCRKLARFEAEACRRASRVVAVSERDAAELAALSGVPQVDAVPNGVDTAYFSPLAQPPAPGSLVFVGGFSWFPNRDAMAHFCRETLPLVAAQVPGVSLCVVGSQPAGMALQAPFNDTRVQLLGRVEDMRPVVGAAAVYVVPLRIGGGTRLKILDALALGKAIVSTTVGAEGLAVTHGQDILLADTPEAFAAAVVRLLQDPAEAQRLGANGRRLAVERYEWNVVGQGLRQAYREACPDAYREAGPVPADPASPAG